MLMSDLTPVLNASYPLSHYSYDLYTLHPIPLPSLSSPTTNPQHQVLGDNKLALPVVAIRLNSLRNNSNPAT